MPLCRRQPKNTPPMPRLSGLLVLVLMLSAAGCSPRFHIQAETIVNEAQEVERRLAVQVFPGPGVLPGQQTRIADHLAFAPAGRYREFGLQDRKMLLKGVFPRYEQIPADLCVKLPGFARHTQNSFHRRAVDFRLFALVDYEERLGDLADRADGEAALREMLDFLLPDVMAMLAAQYGEAYDLSGLEAYVRAELPPTLLRLYDGLWEMRRAKRSGLSGLGEAEEGVARLLAEARALGIDLRAPDPADPAGAWEENKRRFLRWAGTKVSGLVRPRHPSTPPLSPELFSDPGLAERFNTASASTAIVERHGSLDAYFMRLGGLLPRSFGAFLMPRLLPIPWYAHYRFQMRLTAPGRVIQTNGLVDFDGSVVWNFSGEDAALAGQSMWARTAVLDPEAVTALGIVGFPGRVAVLDYLAALMSGPGGFPRQAVLSALEASIAEGGTGPLARLGASRPDAEPGTDEFAARQLVELLDRFRAASNAAGLSPSSSTAPSEADGGNAASEAAEKVAGASSVADPSRASTSTESDSSRALPRSAARGLRYDDPARRQPAGEEP